MQGIVGLGAGGHAKSVLEAVLAEGRYQVVALLDPDRTLWGTGILDVVVKGDDLWLPKLRKRGVRYAFLGVGDASLRQALVLKILSADLRLLTVIHPTAYASPTAQLGAGTVLLANAVVGADAVIGQGVIVNSAAVVEHDCNIGDFSHIAPGSRLGGGVNIGVNALIGLGAVVREGTRIGSNAKVGAGAVVLADVAEEAVVVGIPARPV